MTTRHGNAVLQHLRRAILLDGGAGLTDGQLLGCFIDQRDDAAFAALVRRHGPMVLSVCKRIVGNVHDADDAFQATFLVLIRKAASIKPRELVSNWLYGVAYHTALKARALAARRQAREKQVTAMPEPEATARPNDNLDLQILLDQELSRLPDKYRVPIVLCDLEGKSRKEAARQLGWLDGTLSGRLARARQLLAKRLTQRGFAVSAGVIAVVLSQTAAPASVPAALLVSTVKAASVFAAGQAAGVASTHAATLAEGVLKTMLFAKLKTVTTVCLLVGIVSLGLGFSSGGRSTGQDKTPSQVAQKDTPGPSTDKDAPLKDRRGDRVDEKLKVDDAGRLYPPHHRQPNDKVDEKLKVDDEKLKAERMTKQLAELRAKCDLLQAELEVTRKVGEELRSKLAVTQKTGDKQLESKEVEIQMLKDENALLKTRLARMERLAERKITAAEKLSKTGATSQQAAKDLKTAEFYRAGGHPESAAFYYELVIRRYPGTSYAKEAAKRRDELFDKFEIEQGGAAALSQLKEENDRLKLQYEKVRREADELRDQIERLRKFLDNKPPKGAKS